MQNALVVVDPVEGIDQLLAEAELYIAGQEATLTLLHVISESEFEKDRRAMADLESEEYSSYSFDQGEKGAAEIARDIGEEHLNVDFDTVGAVGERYPRIMDTIRERDIDHIFIPGKKRSPSGKAIFGDLAQRIILNVDFPVTVLTRD